MSSIKITPLILFLILLIVLVTSVVFGNKFFTGHEGFVSFQYDKKPVDYVLVPSYSSKNNVVKLYDNMFFDNNNGNIIEVDSTTYIGNIDLTGNTVTNTYVTQRTSHITVTYTLQTYVTSQDTDSSILKTVESSYASFLYPSQSPATDKYSLFYIPWLDSTYVHILDNTTSMQLGTFLFGPNKTLSDVIYPASTPVGLTSYIKDADANTNKSVTDDFYDPKKPLYQMSKYVKYDIANSNLIIQQGDGPTKQITIYDRYFGSTPVASANTISNTTTTVPNVPFQPYTVMDLCGQNLVVYMPVATKTVIALISFKDSTMASYTLANVKRFGSTAVDNGPDQSESGSHNRHHDESGIFGGGIGDKDSAISEYFKWYWYWKSAGAPGQVNYSDDYILKTQIVPPVCPTCPACPANSTCTNCGGQGGSGTLSTNGNTIAGGNNNRTNFGGAVSNVAGDITKVADKTIDAAGNVVKETVGLAKDAAKGTVGLAKDTASGTVGLAKDTVKGAVGLAKETVSGTIGLAKEAGHGLSNLLPRDKDRRDNSRSTQVDQKGMRDRPLLGTQNQYTDQYSYYGQLPAKDQSDFMPVTANFSAFGK